MKDRLQAEIRHARSIGESEYADDLQFVLDVPEGKYPKLRHKLKTIQEAAEWVGINLKPFEE